MKKLQVKVVILLENAGKNIVKSLTVKIKLGDLAAELIDKFDAQCKEYKGSQ